MKSAQDEIRRILGGKKIKSVDERLKEIMDNPAIKEFMNDHADLPMSVYKTALPQLSQFAREKMNCERCQGLETCGNMQPGFYSELVSYETYIDIRLKKCPRLVAFEEAKKRSELMQTYVINKSVREATFETMEFDPDRLSAIEAAMEYCTLFENGNIPKHGLYLHGSFGVGKSHIAASIANFLSGMGVDTYMVYVPEFVESVYQSIKEKKTNKLMEAVKKVKVLVLDGAENLNPWLRDGIFGTLLQHRAAEELPTIYTSNLTLDELEIHFSFTAKGGEEKVKAARVMERIRHYVKPLEVRGKNRRKEAF